MKKLVNSNVSESAKLHHGVTVIEVLTSMLVALIGVFGVLILIPFSVQQAQIGLDQDAAGVVADNAFEDLQIYGFTEVNADGSLNLRGAAVGLTPPAVPTDPPTTIPPFFGTPLNMSLVEKLNVGVPNITVPSGCYVTPRSVLTPELIHLDPIALSNVGIPSAAAPNNPAALANNPDFLTGSLPATTGTFSVHEDFGGVDRTLNPLRMVVATGVSNTTFVEPVSGITTNELLSLPEINRIFRTEDDIVTGKTNLVGTEVSDIELAQPLFDVSSQGNLVKRQVNGRISWSAVLQPIKDPTRVSTTATATPATQYKVFILVYGDRSVIPTDVDSQMIAAPVLRHLTTENPDTFTPPQHGGYDPAVNQITLAPDIPAVGVFRDDWVMLINRRPAPVGGVPFTTAVPVFDPLGPPILQQLVADEAGYATQVSFAKVISVDSENDTVPGDSTVLHVDGGAFDFYYSDIHGGNPLLVGQVAAYTSATYVISLKNVLNVYERTITLDIQ